MTNQPLNGRVLARWREPGGATRASLYCLPHAGAGVAAFRGLAEALAEARPGAWDVVALRMAGREKRFGERARTDLTVAVSELAEAIADDHRRGPDTAVVLLGQCSGALLAAQVARAAASARALISVSGPAPGEVHEMPDPALPDAQFTAELAELGGIPAEALELPDVLSAFTPTAKADVALARACASSPLPRLACPILAVCGTDDFAHTREAALAWSRLGDPRSRIRELRGGHFLLSDNPRGLAQVVNEELGLLGCADGPDASA